MIKSIDTEIFGIQKNYIFNLYSETLPFFYIKNAHITFENARQLIVKAKCCPKQAHSTVLFRMEGEQELLSSSGLSAAPLVFVFDVRANEARSGSSVSSEEAREDSSTVLFSVENDFKHQLEAPTHSCIMR